MKRFHVHVAVQDLHASASFYSQLFAMQPSKQRPDYVQWKLDDPPLNFAISTTAGGRGINHLGIEASSPAELVTMRENADRATQGGAMDQGRVSCCYAASEKHWTIDPQGVAWEHFMTLADTDSAGCDATQATPCCIPLHATAESAAQERCCVPAAHHEAGWGAADKARMTHDSLTTAFQEMHARLHSYLCRRGLAPSQADDILQDVFLKALVTMQQGTKIRHLPAWLQVATRTAWVDHWRRRRPKSMSEETLEQAMTLPAQSADHEDTELEQALAQCAASMVAALPPLYRDTLHATDLQQRPMKVVAAEQGVSVSAIKSRSARARYLLRQALQTCCGVGFADGKLAASTQCSRRCDQQPSCK